MQKIAIRAAAGIGDALLMLLSAETFRKQKALVTLFTPHHTQLKPLFPLHHLAPYGPIDSSYDHLILQNDNTALDLVKTDRERLTIFYPTYNPRRHPPLAPQDIVFQGEETMVKNIMRVSSTTEKHNGLTLPPGLTFQKYPQRVVLHPTSADPSHIYPRHKFLKIAQRLTKRGYDVHFIVSPQELPEWASLPYPVHAMPLAELASFLYESRHLIGNESGPAHLASNVGLSTTMIGSCPKRLKLWRPDFTPGIVLTPSPLIPNWKGCRLRGAYWHYFIRASRASLF